MTGIAAAFRGRVRASRPSLPTALLGTCLWAGCAAANAAVALWMRGWWGLPVLKVVLLFAVGAALAFAPALWLGRFVGGAKRRETVFAAVFLSLVAGTIAATALLFSWQYRLYYAHWHAQAFTVLWAFQLVFTSAASLYQFAVLGLRLFFPFTFAAIFAVAVVAARRAC